MSRLRLGVSVPSPSILKGLMASLDPPHPGHRPPLKWHLLPSLLQGVCSRGAETCQISVLDLLRSSIVTKANSQTAKTLDDGGDVQEGGSGLVSVKACDILS